MKRDTFYPLKSLLLLGLLTLLTLLYSHSAHAQLSSPQCQINSSTFNLGTYSSNGSVDSQQTLSFSCSGVFDWNDPVTQANFKLCLYMGQDPGSKAGYQPWRYLQNNNINGGGVVYMAYNLYADSARSQILPPVGGASPLSFNFSIAGAKGSTFVSGTGSVTLYARIPGNQSGLVAGNYYSYNPPFTLTYQAVGAGGTPASGGNTPSGCSGSGTANSAGQIQITSQATDNCTLSATPLNFGNISDVGSVKQARNAQSNIQVSCSNGKVYTLYLGDGNNRVSGNGLRQMANGKALLPYQVYQDVAHTQVWDGGTGNTLTGGKGGVNGVGNGSNQSINVYGMIPAGTKVPGTAGSYTDTLVITVAY